MIERNVRIIKVGGSLFDAPWLAERLNQWLDRQAPAANIFVAGGGPLVGSIRQLDRLHQIGEVPAHWLCVRAMGVTARLLVDLFTDAALIDTIEAAEELIDSRPEKLSVFDPAPLLTTVEATAPGTVLPHGWLVTSDSIAARLAEILRAGELVLLKSTLPTAESVEQASKQGYVDEFLPTIARELPRVRCVNLRDESLAEIVFTKTGD
jgi:aspartokinase-like uncharacterized kinase